MPNGKPKLNVNTGREYFEAHALEWDELRRSYYSDAVAEDVLRRAIDGKILDVGCGTGFLLLRALDDKRFTKVYGVDFSHSMLERLKDEAWGKRSPSLRLADANTRLPFPEKTFDSVVSNMFLHHLEYPAAGIYEMARVLRPGGRLVLADLREHAHEWFRDEMADRWLGFKEPDVREWMADANLDNVQIESNKECCVSISSKTGEPSAVEIFIAQGDKKP
ncbi:MAG TPA: methyltransferase domain-containing protein [Candidatus Thermoplasmatota archaeon]|nr:methyltransferase domain-containing protein [Candidatus Thermoplasmatota archaeon]